MEGKHLFNIHSFILPIIGIYKKGLKAYFKLRKDFLSLNPWISNNINVFDHTIKPILLYGSEIWGIFNINNAKDKTVQ